VTPLAKALGVSRKTLYVWRDEPPPDIAVRLLAAVKAERERFRRRARGAGASTARTRSPLRRRRPPSRRRLRRRSPGVRTSRTR